MFIKIFYRYHLVDELPWPFLVSIASLFLTLDAVSFFHYFYFLICFYSLIDFNHFDKK